MEINKFVPLAVLRIMICSLFNERWLTAFFWRLKLHFGLATVFLMFHFFARKQRHNEIRFAINNLFLFWVTHDSAIRGWFMKIVEMQHVWNSDWSDCVKISNYIAAGSFGQNKSLFCCLTFIYQQCDRFGGAFAWIIYMKFISISYISMDLSCISRMTNNFSLFAFALCVGMCKYDRCKHKSTASIQHVYINVKWKEKLLRFYWATH